MFPPSVNFYRVFVLHLFFGVLVPFLLHFRLLFCFLSFLSMPQPCFQDNVFNANDTEVEVDDSCFTSGSDLPIADAPLC